MKRSWFLTKRAFLPPGAEEKSTRFSRSMNSAAVGILQIHPSVMEPTTRSISMVPKLPAESPSSFRLNRSPADLKWT